ncbi:hypothetical protein SALBM311S_06432 [Streptomyces alboniger]
MTRRGLTGDRPSPAQGPADRLGRRSALRSGLAETRLGTLQGHRGLHRAGARMGSARDAQAPLTVEAGRPQIKLALIRTKARERRSARCCSTSAALDPACPRCRRTPRPSSPAPGAICTWGNCAVWPAARVSAAAATSRSRRPRRWTSPDTPAEEKAYLRDSTDFGKLREGLLLLADLAHVSRTTDSARDMTHEAVPRRHRTRTTSASPTAPHSAGCTRTSSRRTWAGWSSTRSQTRARAWWATGRTVGSKWAPNAYLKSTGQDPGRGSRKIADLLRRLDANPLPTASRRQLDAGLRLHRASSCRCTAGQLVDPDQRASRSARGDGRGFSGARRRLQRA